MSLYYRDPTREPRECQTCGGEGAEDCYSSTTGRPIKPTKCTRCNGTGKLGNPGALPDLDVFQNPATGDWFWVNRWRNEDDSVSTGGPFNTEAEALAAAREET